MKRLGPFHTLAAGAIFTVALGVLSAQAGPTTTRATAASADSYESGTGEPSAAPSAEASAETSAEASAAPSAQPSASASAEPAADPTPKHVDYAGVVQGNGGLIAISIRNGKAIAYFCDGRNESWLKGKAENDTVTLEGKNSLLTAALGGGKAQGRLQVGNAKWHFVAPIAKKPSGLYRASAFVRGARISGTWIKLANGQQVGSVTIGNEAEAAPVLTRDGTADIYGTTLKVADVDYFFAAKAS
jgi:hypothetical protein